MKKNISKRLESLENRYHTVEVRLSGYEASAELVIGSLNGMVKLFAILEAKIDRQMKLLKVVGETSGVETNLEELDKEMVLELMEKYKKEMEQGPK